MNTATQKKWDQIYHRNAETANPIAFLTEHAFLLPTSGRALDLACGLGANACFLAHSGLSVDAWDISTVALNKLSLHAKASNLTVNTHCFDIRPNNLLYQTYDVIVVSRFLDRLLVDALMTALNPGGLLFYQTFIQQKVANIGPNNPDYLLTENELLNLFSDLTVLFYREFGIEGDHCHGLRNEAQLLAKKPIT